MFSFWIFVYADGLDIVCVLNYLFFNFNNPFQIHRSFMCINLDDIQLNNKVYRLSLWPSRGWHVTER